LENVTARDETRREALCPRESTLKILLGEHRVTRFLDWLSSIQAAEAAMFEADAGCAHGALEQRSHGLSPDASWRAAIRAPAQMRVRGERSIAAGSDR